MASLPSHSSQLQHQDRQHQWHQQQQHPQHLSPQNLLQSPHQLYPSGSSPNFDGTSPIARDQLHQRSGSENTRGGGVGRNRQDDDDEDDDATNAEWGLTKAGKKRQRLPLACQVCRKKKVLSIFENFSSFCSSIKVGNRSVVQGSNQYVNIVFDFHCPVSTKQLHLDGPEIP